MPQHLGDPEPGNFIVARTKYSGREVRECLCGLEMRIEFLSRLVRGMTKHHLRYAKLSGMGIQVEHRADVAEQMYVYVDTQAPADCPRDQLRYHPTPLGLSALPQEQHVGGFV